MFQSTRPRGARRTCSATALRPPCFNPRARVGRDVGVDQQQRVVGVSIHAPAWGATSHMCRPSTCRSGFNPRARVGRDIRMSSSFWLQTCFNPRARVGRDAAAKPIGDGICGFNPRARVGRDLACQVVDIGQLVSIHAPAWGATSAYLDGLIDGLFQSTRPRGARPCSARSR